MNLSVRELNAFLYVAQLGSFTRAAERMRVTQAGLSMMIRSLENQLNCRLFDRTTRAVSLTEAGAALLPVATRTVSELSAVAARIGALNAAGDQSLRVGATPLVCSGFLPAICQEFMQIHRNVSLEVFEIPFPQVHAQVDAGHIDIGLCVDVLRRSTIERHPIFSVSLELISKSTAARASGHACRNPTPLRWAELPELPMIALKSDDPLQNYIDRHLARVGRLAPPSMAVGSVETQIAMVQAGLGPAIIPSLALHARAYPGIETSLLTDPDPDLDFCCLHKSGRRRTSALDGFIDIAAKGFSRSLSCQGARLPTAVGKRSSGAPPPVRLGS
jgi:DNA-binding transcriptional LysR family regulator